MFMLGIPFAVAVVMLSSKLSESRDPGAEGKQLDFTGAILTAVALGALSYVMVEGQNGGFTLLDWAALALAIVAGSLLVVVERRAEHPMLPLRLFANRPFAASNLLTLLVYGGLGLSFFLLAIQLQVSLGWSALQAGAAVLPVTGLLVILSPSVGGIAERIGPRWLLTVGPMLIAGGMLLYTRIGPESEYLPDVLPGLVVFGLGLSISVAPVTATALRSVPDDRAGAASGANNAIARTGQLLAVAAIPPLVGLTGEALNTPEQLDRGFPVAMVASAALVALGGIVSALFLRRTDLGDS
jgi:Na+/melibiose symporter-like transporter